MKLARSPPPPFAQPEQSRVANVTIPKSRVLALQVLRILRTKGFENFLIIFPIFFPICYWLYGRLKKVKYPYARYCDLVFESATRLSELLFGL